MLFNPLVMQVQLPVTNPVLTFAIFMILILVAPLAIQRLRGPGMLGMILAGVIVGPNALNILERSDVVVLLGTVGLLYIMFLAGIEIDLNRFRKYRSHSITFGVATFLLPQSIGTVMAIWFLGFDWPAAILLASMFASHTLLSYPIASRLGLSKDRAVTTTIGGTIITDTAALLVLAVVARSSQGSLDAQFWVTLVLSLSVYVGLVWWGLPRIGRWFFRTVPVQGVSHFVFILAAVYLCAYFAEVAGVEAIIGAFLAGLALNRLVPQQSVLMNRLDFAGNWFFIPIFLLSVGMLVDPRVLLSDAQTWKVVGAMTITVVTTKFLAAWCMTRLLGYDTVEAWVIFGLSVNQAAATLATVMIGFQLGIFDEAVLNGAIIMILTTCIIGPWATQRYGRRLALLHESRPEDRSLAPRRILIPLRNPDAADAILDIAIMIREPGSFEPVYPLTVVQDRDDASALLAAGERMLGHAVMHAAAANVPVVPTVRLDTSAVEGMVRAIRELRISTVVMGWTGSNPARNRVFGTVLDQLLARCSQQFLVCRLCVPLNAHQRLLLVVPPFAEREVGYIDAIQTIKSLADRAGMVLAICAVESEMNVIVSSIDRVRPSVTIERTPIRSLDVWLGSGAPALTEGDLFVLLSARRQQVSWRPSVDRIPQQMIVSSPHISTIVVYPSEESAEADAPLSSSEVRTIELSGLFSVQRLVLHSDASTPREAINALLERLAHRDQKSVENLGNELEKISVDAPIEITPGFVLLHMHTVHVDRPLGFLLTTREDIAFGNLRAGVRCVFALLTPTSLPPAVHLQHLARIAKLLHDTADVSAILETTSPEALYDWLRDRDNDSLGVE
ncbi:MAG: cation:proton antiporter [Phycisphaerales bacterium]|nr:MAG: cation:proton antiporter [Phycisphaerales bacterium]